MAPTDLYVPLYEEERNAAPATVCVTGASGFVAGPIIERLLAAGHTVHATVRDPANNKMSDALRSLPGADERLKLFKGNLLEPGSFKEAMQGCKFVMHTASPFFLECDVADVKSKLLEPALQGTTNVLDTVNETPSVERVVLTSSVAAIWTSDRPEGHQFTEADWADSASETDRPYFLSKKLAEEKAWEMAKAQTRWKLVCINPGYVFGPPIGDRADGESIQIICDVFDAKYNESPGPDFPFSLVDVRDVAAAHCLAMVHPNAQGRNITVEGDHTVLQVTEYMAERFPNVKVPERGSGAPAQSMYSNEKIQRELGFKFHSGKTAVQDMVERLIKTGRIQISSAFVRE